MRTVRFYNAYNFSIRSDIEISGAIALADSGSEPDIDVMLGHAALAEPHVQEAPYRVAGSSLLFEKPGIAAYLCEDGRRITVSPAEGASAADVGDFLVATALPALLWMRGEIVLHAAGFVMEGSAAAIAVCGPSGSGKSTVLRSLIDLGGQVVGDDTLRAEVSPYAIRVSGLPSCYRWGSATGGRLRYSVDGGNFVAHASLGAIFILGAPRSESRPRFEKLSGIRAFQSLLVQRHRPRVPRLVGKEAFLLSGMRELAQIEIYIWHRSQSCLTLADEEISFLKDRARLPWMGIGEKLAQ